VSVKVYARLWPEGVAMVTDAMSVQLALKELDAV
jgi:hypothetical protein